MLLAPRQIRLLVLSLYHSNWYKKCRADQVTGLKDFSATGSAVVSGKLEVLDLRND
jgi:hypothetical protein